VAAMAAVAAAEVAALCRAVHRAENFQTRGVEAADVGLALEADRQNILP